ncbi:MAG: hypothetical protein Q7L07_13165 [Pseudohongiella sp.]|nr:hypothetical protein [Pseudohongiella sp.]
MNDKLDAQLLAHELLITHLLMITSYRARDPAGFIKEANDGLIERLPKLTDVRERGSAFEKMVEQRITALTTSAVASMP